MQAGYKGDMGLQPHSSLPLSLPFGSPKSARAFLLVARSLSGRLVHLHVGIEVLKLDVRVSCVGF